MRASRFAAFALALSASPARGAPVQAGVEPVTVLAFQVDAMADAELDRAAKSLTNALRQAVLDAPEYTLGGQSPTIYAAAYDAKCPLKVAPGRPVNESTFDEACLRKVGRSLGAKRFLWGFLSPGDGQRPVARLHLWQEGRPGRSVSLPYDPAARDRVVERLYRKLVTPERVGDVALAGAVEGELVVDGNAAGPYAPGVELTLPAGEHAVEVRQGSRVVARTSARVEAGARVEAQLEPVAQPPPPPALPPSADPGALPVVMPRGAWKRTAGFVGLGLGAALIGAGVLAGLRVRSLDDGLDAKRAFVAYRTDIGADGDLCDAADADVGSWRAGAATAARVRRVCSGGATLQVAQLVFYGASALAVGTGAYLLATAPKAPAARKPSAWSLHPWVGASGSGLRLGLTF
ncbi:MAG TPA: hypothetical protein VFS00_09480 [Polyangiaceae bacterium]|nr:hypothetical protein [Polyangiaceae bacterium]